MDIAQRRLLQALARQDHERSTFGGGAGDYTAAGPPYWDRATWDAFHAQYGRYPYTASELPPSFAGAPDWVYELMNMRRPPITVQH